MKIIGAVWFTNMSGGFGIVYGQTEMGEKKAYIGPCSGHDEAIDADHIAQHGGKVHASQLKEVLNFMEK